MEKERKPSYLKNLLIRILGLDKEIYAMQEHTYKKINTLNEMLYIYQEYRSLSCAIMELNIRGVFDFPLDVRMENFDKTHFVEEHDENIIRLIKGLKNDLENLSYSYKKVRRGMSGNGCLSKDDNFPDEDRTIKDIKKMLKEAAFLKVFSEKYHYDISDIMEDRIQEWKDDIYFGNNPEFEKNLPKGHRKLYEAYQKSINDFLEKDITISPIKWSSTPHIIDDAILSDDEKRQELADMLSQRKEEIEGINNTEDEKE